LGLRKLNFHNSGSIRVRATGEVGVGLELANKVRVRAGFKSYGKVTVSLHVGYSEGSVRVELELGKRKVRLSLGIGREVRLTNRFVLG